MTIIEAERFYNQDTKSYELEKNKEFLAWLEASIKDGYQPFIKIRELQELIDNIVTWYEIKYPERELEYSNGIRNSKFQDIKSISDAMGIRELLFRLPHNQLCLMESKYRGIVGGLRPIYENDKIVEWKEVVGIKIEEKNIKAFYYLSDKLPYYLLYFDGITGEVLKNYTLIDIPLEEYIDSKENLNLEELLSTFNEKFTDKLDFTYLKKTVYNHDCDMELRHRILQLTALKLLYSKNTIPTRGYERAKRFINEFNEKLGLTLSTEEIDEIIHRDYTNGERCELVLETYIDEYGEECSFWTIKKVAKEEKQAETKGVKRLIKYIFDGNKNS